MTHFDNEKGKCKLIIAASPGWGEDSKVAHIQIGDFKLDDELDVLFHIYLLQQKQNSSKLGENLAVEEEGRGQISEITERRGSGISRQILEGFNVPL